MEGVLEVCGEVFVGNVVKLLMVCDISFYWGFILFSGERIE